VAAGAAASYSVAIEGSSELGMSGVEGVNGAYELLHPPQKLAPPFGKGHIYTYYTL